MTKPRTLVSFSAEEHEKAHAYLAVRVAHMMGRKLEEGDWAEVYCRAKGISRRGWSNLNIDVMHGALGVEHKMYRYSSKGDITRACGTTIMHPSATRSLRVPPISTPANDAMRDVLGQYGDLIRARERKVREQAGGESEPDMRMGWLLWQVSLRQFLYFEEEMRPPNPDEYEARWTLRTSKGGSRKSSTNLWIYEKATGTERYSITTEAGAKIQPYFDVPPLTDPNVHVFTVIGEIIEMGLVRVWLTDATIRELTQLLGNMDTDTLSRAILDAVRTIERLDDVEEAERELARPFTITADAYAALTYALPGASDEHSFQLLAEHLRTQ